MVWILSKYVIATLAYDQNQYYKFHPESLLSTLVYSVHTQDVWVQTVDIFLIRETAI